jgi:hypothetical protein
MNGHFDDQHLIARERAQQCGERIRIPESRANGPSCLPADVEAGGEEAAS